MVVNPADVTTTVHKAAEDAKEVALETMHDVRDRIHELRHDTKPPEKHTGRTIMLIVLAAIGLAVVVAYVKRRQEADYGPSSDAFGAAVVEQQRATEDGQPVATPGA